MLSNEIKEIKNNMEKENENDKNKSFKESVKDWFDNFVLFLKKNIIELLIVFVLILCIVLLHPPNQSYLKQKGGANVQPTQPLQPQQPPAPAAAPAAPVPAPSATSIKTKEMVAKVGQTLKSSKAFQSFLTTVYSILNAVYIFGVLIFTLAVVPALPLFACMFIIFVILRNRMASFKAL